MATKKRKLVIVDVFSPVETWSARAEHEKIIKEIQGLHKKHGTSNMPQELWDTMAELEKAKTPEEAQPLINSAHVQVAGHFYGMRADKLDKLADFLESKGDTDRADSLKTKAQEMRDSPEKFLAPKEKPTKEKKDKTPVFQSPEKQKLVLAKYPWVIDGTFRQDPDKPGGTCLDIKCQKCTTSRTIHLADAFQVKLCLKCKNS